MTELVKISSIEDLQENYRKIAEHHLKLRFSDNPEFQKEFVKTLSDMIFSLDDDGQANLLKMRGNSLMNAVFKATEAGASFAKREVTILPMRIFKKVNEKGVEKKIDTGMMDAVTIFDINFQKQKILAMKNCKRFFTAQVHDGVTIAEDLETGNYLFSGTNDATKPTVGYYACFITTEGEKYDLFMSNAEITERAKMNPHFDGEKYKSTIGNIHLEKIVVRNLLKLIPRMSEELRSIVSYDEVGGYTEYEDVTHATAGELPEQTTTSTTSPKVSKLDAAKRAIAIARDGGQEVEISDIDPTMLPPDADPKTTKSTGKTSTARSGATTAKTGKSKFDAEPNYF